MTRTLLWLALALSLAAVAPAQHAHINAGAVERTQDAKLRFVNGANFVADSGFFLPLASAAEGSAFEGLYQGTTTFTALPATIFTGGPAPGHASPGTFIEAKLVSMTGASGAEFVVWQVDEEFGTADRLASITSGTTNGVGMFALSDNDKSPGADPFGHIHGRQLSLNKPGLYTVGFQLVDTASNGAAGRPIHAPSDLFQMYFQAGVTIAFITRSNGETSITFAAAPGYIYQLEATTDLKGEQTVWSPVGDPHEGLSYLHTVIDPQADLPSRFYRLKLTPDEE